MFQPTTFFNLINIEIVQRINPHFERTSFRVGKKIFATLHEPKKIATLKFSVIDQSVYCAVDKAAIYPVQNKWGIQGWTFIELNKVSAKLMTESLKQHTMRCPARGESNNNISF